MNKFADLKRRSRSGEFSAAVAAQMCLDQIAQDLFWFEPRMVDNHRTVWISAVDELGYLGSARQRG